MQDPHPFEISNALAPGSYVSLESLFAFRGLISEAVYVTTAVRVGSDDPEFVRERRLQRLDEVDSERLRRMAERTGSRKVSRGPIHGQSALLPSTT